MDERLAAIVKRCRAFYAAQEPGHFLVRTLVAAEAPPIPPLYSYDFSRQVEEFMDCLLAAARPGWLAREGLDDDAVNCISPRFGVAEHSAWTGTPVRLQENTSLPTPIIHEWKDLDRLRLSTDAPWFQYMKRAYDRLRSRRDGTYLLCVRGSEMPMDLANAIRGDQLFMDFLLAPAQVHRLMAWCVDALRWYYQHLLSWCDQVQDGHIFNYSGSWLGPHCLGHVSNDAAMLCSRQVYEEFGYPYELKLMEHFGGLFYHLHTEQMHFVPKAASLPKVRLLEMTPDPKSPAPIENLPFIFAHTGNANLLIYAKPEQARRHIEELKRRNVFLTISCETRAEAAEMIRFVRGHSRPL